MERNERITVGIVGLGLIGGSLAKAYRKEGHCVLGYDADPTVTGFAKLSGIISEELTPEGSKVCDLILVAVYPAAAVKYIEENGKYFSPDTLVIDCCGTKTSVCDPAFRAAEKYGFTFVGGHPMAGTHNSGIKFSSEDMFKGAPMALVPPSFNDIELLEKVKRLLDPAGFGSYSVCTAEEHDRKIAFTSQLAHIVSGAYIKSPTAEFHKGLSAGSYRDMTRVAWLNPDMWTELFLDNGENLTFELDELIDNLKKYRDAIAEGDRENLRRLLDEGRRRKERVDGNDKNQS